MRSCVVVSTKKVKFFGSPRDVFRRPSAAPEPIGPKFLLLYATKACPFLARDQSSLSFAVTRVLMKIFRTRSRDVTDQCQIMFGMLPVEHHVFLRKVRFLLRFKNSDNLICSLFLDDASSEIN